MSVQPDVLSIINNQIEAKQIIPISNSYPINLYNFFIYILNKFLNPDKMKLTSFQVIKNIYMNLNNDKHIIFINMAMCMYDFAIKIKGDSVRKLIGFKDCGFIGLNNQQIKLDFVIKYSEFMAAFYYDYNYLLLKYFYVMHHFIEIDKYYKQIFIQSIKKTVKQCKESKKIIENEPMISNCKIDNEPDNQPDNQSDNKSNS